jgi:hypothetical protein
LARKPVESGAFGDERFAISAAIRVNTANRKLLWVLGIAPLDELCETESVTGASAGSASLPRM